MLAGIEWVRANAVRPAVVNISVGGPRSDTVNEAVEGLIAAGLPVSVSAGNADSDACDRSPASATGAMTVAASDKTDARAAFSNHGVCVDLYAPGSRVLSAALGGGTRTASGTSMASPHVAGVSALYLSQQPSASPQGVATWLNANAEAGVIQDSPAGTTADLLQTGGL